MRPLRLLQEFGILHRFITPVAALPTGAAGTPGGVYNGRSMAMPELINLTMLRSMPVRACSATGIEAEGSTRLTL